MFGVLLALQLLALALLVARRPADAFGRKLNVELRDSRKHLRLACGAIVRKLDALDIDLLLRRCLTPNLGGLRKGDVVVFCYHDCVHCDHVAGCDQAFVVRRIGVRPEIDGGGPSVPDEEPAESYWVAPGVDDADHVPIAIGPVARAFLVHDKDKMRIVVPPMLAVVEHGDHGGDAGRDGGEA